jgi:hypothetical protein
MWMHGWMDDGPSSFFFSHFMIPMPFCLASFWRFLHTCIPPDPNVHIKVPTLNYLSIIISIIPEQTNPNP